MAMMKTWTYCINIRPNIGDKYLHNFLMVMKETFYRWSMTLNHHLAIEMLTKAFTAFMEVLRKYIGFL